MIIIIFDINEKYFCNDFNNILFNKKIEKKYLFQIILKWLFFPNFVKFKS